MIDAWILDWSAWWASVPPGFAFLMALPFLVGGLGLRADRRRG